MSKYIYEENEMFIVDNQCELCEHFNDGKLDASCPFELIEKIKKNEIVCPNISERSIFDD